MVIMAFTRKQGTDYREFLRRSDFFLLAVDNYFNGELPERPDPNWPDEKLALYKSLREEITEILDAYRKGIAELDRLREEFKESELLKSEPIFENPVDAEIFKKKTRGIGG